MIHVITVHWKNDCWIDIQLKYLKANIHQPFKIYAFLNDIPKHHQSKYDYYSTEPIKEHAIKLNLLADIAILNSTSPEDWLIFIDGDAFPIRDICLFGASKLTEYPLIAVQRLENNGDIQPHPCFCLTTVKFWKEIQGDWKSGYKWPNAQGKWVTDVGGNLLKQLEGIEWYPMVRTNKKNIHPLFFGIYDDLIYHHGAGFRTPHSRVDDILLFNKVNIIGVIFYKMLWKIFSRFPKGKIRKFALQRLKHFQKSHSADIVEASQNLLEAIKESFYFYKKFEE